MASVQLLEAELKKLGQQKRLHKFTEKSLSILEDVKTTDDKKSFHLLRSHDEFMDPFIMACLESNAKSCASALQCIQTMATYAGIAPNRLKELLAALREATQLGLGIQLKILQVLPVILFEFAVDLNGELVVDLIGVCIELLKSNKVAMVHNTAYATLQQLINGVFNRTDLLNSNEKIELSIGDHVKFFVKPSLHDSAMLLVDLCDLAEMGTPRFTNLRGLSLTFNLELLELTLSNQSALIHKYDELASVLRIRVVPLLLRLFSEASEFATVLRVTRIFYLLLKQHLQILQTESEVILSTITQCANSSILWKRSLCLEVLQGMFLELKLLVDVYVLFDKRQQRTSILNAIISDLASSLNEVNLTDLEQLSKNVALTVPIIEMLDRVDPPVVDDRYPYYQILKCINSFADDIHKLVASNSQATQLLEDTSGALFKCYLNAFKLDVDLDLFRLIVRGVQRLAHASGIVDMSKTRDEFIGLLANHSLPSTDGLNRSSISTRALFNLGYALGNQLNQSWDLITTTIISINEEIPKTDPISIECIFGNYDQQYAQINQSLRKLMESTTKLSDEALTMFMLSIGNKSDKIKYEILRNVLVLNESRSADPDLDVFKSFAMIILNGVKNEPENTLDAVTVLNDVSSWVVNYTELNVDDVEVIDRTLAMVIQILCSVIKDTSNLKIKATPFQDLNGILEKYGQHIISGWQSVFEIVIEIPKLRNLELLRIAFITLELICSDFLDNLPLPCIFSLTLCLDEFSKQDVDLNTSFTSMSLFWSVCDHLIPHDGQVVECTLNADDIQSESDLIKIAKPHLNGNEEPDKMALWLLAVIKLSSIAGEVDQHQVRTSAIQIFLRIFNTHGSRLPKSAWDIAHNIAFPTLLFSAKSSSLITDPENLEVFNLVIEGINRIDLLFLPTFYDLKSFKKFWTQWITFLNESTLISPFIASTVYKNLKLIIENNNSKLLNNFSFYDFWKQQNASPQYAEKFPKPTADALKDLISLYSLVNSNSTDLMKDLELICQCAIFPYYTSPMPLTSSEREKINTKHPMSALQYMCTTTLDLVDINGNWEILPKYLLLLNQLAKAPYENHQDLKVNYVGLSLWAQHALSELIPTKNNFNTNEISAQIISTMNTVIHESLEMREASNVILKLVALSETSHVHHSKELVKSVSTVLEVGYLHPTNATSFIERLINSVKTKEVDIESWHEILECLLTRSVLYERFIHNLSYYQKESKDLTKALSYGTTDIPKQINNEKLSLFCLEMLCTLGCDGGVYSPTALKFFQKRTEAVLFQYVGDCRLLGQEPIRELLKTELVCVLQELIKHPQTVNNTLRSVLLDAIACAHSEIQPYLHQILQSAR